MCRLALLNRQAVTFLGSALEYVFGCLEHTLGGDGNGVAGLWTERATTKMRKGVKFTAAQAAACAREYVEQGADWVLFHTRRATSSAVENRHCHPFRSGQLVLAHNGHDTHFAKLGKAIGISDSECIARTWSRLRFPRAKLATRSGVFIGFAREYPFVVKGQQSSDLIAAWEESSGAFLFASELPFWIADGAFDHVIPLGTIQWFGDELDLETLEAHRQRIPLSSRFYSHWGAYPRTDDDDDTAADEAAYLEELAYQQELEEEEKRIERENMNNKAYSSGESWKEAIKRIPLGNAFDSDDLFACKVGVYHSLHSEEAYRRAQQVVQRYPQSYRILRYEGHGWEPSIYAVTTDRNWHSILDYITTGKGEIPPPSSKRSSASEGM